MTRQGEPNERTLENVRAFWEAEAADIGNSPEVTIRDFYFRIHELHTLLPLVPRGARLLDAGCGTGFGTLVLSHRTRYALGVDYSPTMIGWANRLLDDPEQRARLSRRLSPLWDLPEVGSGRIEFRHADVLSLDLEEAAFDVVTGQRFLINLLTFEEQLGALRKLRSLVRDDGVLIVGETSLNGYAPTDAYRARFSLPPLERYWHNLYLDEERFGEWRGAGWNVETVLGFDTYMLLSKVVYPAACGEANCAFLSGPNAAAMEMACLFRTRAAAAELGDLRLLGAYADRVHRYDPTAALAIRRWIGENARALPDWSGLGHQRLIVARPCPLPAPGQANEQGEASAAPRAAGSATNRRRGGRGNIAGPAAAGDTFSTPALPSSGNPASTPCSAGTTRTRNGRASLETRRSGCRGTTGVDTPESR